MKQRLLALLLILILVMSACAAPQAPANSAQGQTETPPEASEAPETSESPEISEAPETSESPEISEAPETSEPAITAPSGYVLAAAVRPELPEQPDEAALLEAINAVWTDEDLTDEERMEQDNALWEDYNAKQTAYRDALAALRGEPVENQEDFAAFTEAVAAQLLTGAEENRVLSPANLYLALAMLAEVTGGDTQTQILELLGADSAGTLRALAKRVWENLYLDGENSKTLLANSIWLQEGLDVLDGPMDALSQDYYASAYQVPMGTGEADAALQDWLNENTNHLLEESVGNLRTEDTTLLMLASTLYFKGAWTDAFSERSTAEGEFTLEDGSAVSTDFMHKICEQSASVCDGYTVAALSFAEQGSMIFLLPDEGVSLEEALAGGALRSFLDQSRSSAPYEVHWSVPKFDISSTLQLTDALQALGITDAFDYHLADFSPLIADGDTLLPYVSSVEHAARVTVDEEGCEAAAYTVMAVESAAEAPESRPVLEMNLNRPFLFAITGLDGLPLFIGAVQNPNG